MRIKKWHSILFVVTLVTLSSIAFGQNVLITDVDFDTINPMDCSVYGVNGGTNFFDDGNAGVYSNSFNDTLIVCPDPVNGSKTMVLCNISAGYSFDVDSTDTLFVWDGISTNSLLLGTYNNVVSPDGFSHQASFVNNPTGCLTFAFKSDFADSAAGWAANLSCGTPPQPFYPHMQAYNNGSLIDTLSEPDTGLIKVCPGDSVLYVGSADFPFDSIITGAGYSQHDSTISYKWFFSDGTVLEGDSVWFIPPNNAGYIVTLRVTDQFPFSQDVISSVRVAPRIDFSATRSIEDSICVGDEVTLVAGITATDTVGASSTTSQTEIGGSLAGLTYLPDGNTANYETEINITGFDTGQVLESGMDLLRMDITIEHSYLGDLEMMLSCPSGDSVVIFNSWTGAGIGPAFAGGFGGGGVFLGDAFDPTNAIPGIGWTYSFSDTIPDWGNMPTEFSAGNTLPTTLSAGNAMNPDSIYLPEQTFQDLVGCPINGDWKITVRDNIFIDDGYIFDWAIYFNPEINPNFESYTSSLVDANWYDADSNLLASLGDTSVTIAPDTSGFSTYLFEVTDDFGCFSDTAITIWQTPIPIPQDPDTGTCENTYVTEINGADSAHWVSLFGGDSALSFLPDANDTIVTISSTERGIYTIDIEMFAEQCAYNDTISFEFYPFLPPNVLNDTLGCVDAIKIKSVADFPESVNNAYSWSHNDTLSSNSAIISKTGLYFVTVSGCNEVIDSARVALYRKPFVITPSLICDSLDTVGLSNYNLGGRWAVQSINAPMQGLRLNELDSAASVYGESVGIIQVVYLDSICGTADTAQVFFSHIPTLGIADTVTCYKDGPRAIEAIGLPIGGEYEWSDGTLDQINVVFDTIEYSVVYTNQCGEAKKSIRVKFDDCEYFIPNVLTPDADGINDVFQVHNREFYESVDLIIYNRWGGKVFEGSNEFARWDGALPNARIASEGVYFFFAHIDGVEITGSLTLIY